MELRITCIPGDGIGPEIVAEAKKVLEKVAAVYGHTMKFTDILMGEGGGRGPDGFHRRRYDHVSLVSSPSGKKAGGGSPWHQKGPESFCKSAPRGSLR